ncbi:HK97-gp10 family putative phage morphogenesis protein [Moraxella catarrhalis]|uniref:HK97-gp10 family putative phage morphogenesis protein n=1 Tax=Moraxella catarrhalis TaxID=480 RepID=UPI001F4D6120|nr:HK97-gp10 family putative phage morphogenesis protein [Moraxella catarrhalis]
MHAVPLLVGSRKRLVLDALPKFLCSSVIKMVSQPYFATNPILKEAKNRAPASEDAYRRYMSSGQGEGKTTHTKSGKKRHVATNRAKRGHGRYVIQQAGLLKKSIRRQRLTKNSRNRHRAAVGIGVHLKGKTGETAFYWHMVERGTSQMPAVPFLRPAFDKNVQVAVNAFAKTLKDEIDKIVK